MTALQSTLLLTGIQQLLLTNRLSNGLTTPLRNYYQGQSLTPE